MVLHISSARTEQDVQELVQQARKNNGTMLLLLNKCTSRYHQWLPFILSNYTLYQYDNAVHAALLSMVRNCKVDILELKKIISMQHHVAHKAAFDMYEELKNVHQIAQLFDISSIRVPATQQTVLQYECSRGNLSHVQELIETYKMSIDVQVGHQKMTPLHCLAQIKHTLVHLKMLIKYKPNVNAKDAFNWPALAYYVMNNRKECVEYLIDECGAIVYPCVLYWAQDLQMLHLLLAKVTFKPDYKRILYKQTRNGMVSLDLLNFCCSKQQPCVKRVVKSVIQTDNMQLFVMVKDYFNLSYHDLANMYALHESARYYARNIFGHLSNHISISYCDNNGLYPMDYAIRCRNFQLARTLLEYGAKAREETDMSCFLCQHTRNWPKLIAHPIVLRHNNIYCATGYFIYTIYRQNIFKNYILSNNETQVLQLLRQRVCPSSTCHVTIEATNKTIRISFYLFLRVPITHTDVQVQFF